MKTSFVLRSVSVATVALASIFLGTSGHAQSNETYDGGTGIWDTDPTVTDWNGANPWVDNNRAYFNAASNDVTISGTVEPSYLEFDGGSATTISGGTIAITPFLNGQGGDDNFLADYSSGPVTINSAIELSAMGGNQQAYIPVNNGSTLTLSNIDFGPYVHSDGSTGTSAGRVNFQASANSTVALTGQYTTSGGNGGQFIFNSGTGTYNITSTADFSQFNGGSFDFEGGVLNVANSSFTGQTMNYYGVSNNLLNIQGAQTVNISIYSSQKNSGPMVQDGPNDNPYSIGITGTMAYRQGTTDLSTWTGFSNQNGSNTILEAVSGGRLVWSGDLGSGTPEGLTIGSSTDSTETGTVVLANSTGNDYNEEDGDGYIQPTSTTAADLKSGTTLITNTTGSAFGSATTTAGNPIVQGSATVTEVVKLEGGATLGGNGISAPQIVAEAANSVIAPGDPGYTSTAHTIALSTGKLTLSGGLAAAQGLTMDFKLSETIANSDSIDFGSGVVSIGGVLTINLTSLNGSVNTTSPYTVFSGTGNWSGFDPTSIDINGPTGYTATGNLVTSSSLKQYEITFAEVPEPSTYALLLGGLAGLVVLAKRRRLLA